MCAVCLICCLLNGLHGCSVKNHTDNSLFIWPLQKIIIMNISFEEHFVKTALPELLEHYWEHKLVVKNNKIKNSKHCSVSAMGILKRFTSLWKNTIPCSDSRPSMSAPDLMAGILFYTYTRIRTWHLSKWTIKHMGMFWTIERTSAQGEAPASDRHPPPPHPAWAGWFPWWSAIGPCYTYNVTSG